MNLLTAPYISEFKNKFGKNFSFSRLNGGLVKITFLVKNKQTGEKQIFAIGTDDPNQQSILFGNEYQKFLSGNNINTPKILNQWVTNDNKIATIHEYIDGKTKFIIDEEQCCNLGIQLAKSHKYGIKFGKNRNATTSKNIFILLFKTLLSPLNLILIKIFKIYGIKESKLFRAWRYSKTNKQPDIYRLPKACCHCDLHCWNILWNKNQPYFIDFDWARTRVFIEDITRTILYNAICADSKNIAQTKKNIDAFIKGYETIRKLTPAEKVAFIPLLRDYSFRTIADSIFWTLRTLKNKQFEVKKSIIAINHIV